MKDIILLFCLIAVGVCGYFLMGKLDKFLEENHKAMHKQETQSKRPYIVHKIDANGEIVKNKAESRREDHPCACVVCDPEKL